MTSERPTEKLDGAHPTTLEAPDPTRAPHRVLRVLDGDSVTTIELPEGRTLVLGRSAEADVVIDAGSVSRLHAKLHVGKTLQIEDMGSANGTLVRGVALEPGRRVDVLPGDEVHLGRILCIAQGGARGATSTPLRALRTHEYFEARLEDECARASRDTLSAALHGEGAAGFTLARLRRGGGVGAEFEAALVAAVRPSEVVAWYGPGDYELLLPDASRARERLRDITAALERRGWGVRTGVATYPRDGRTHDALIERADDALRLTAPAAVAATSGEALVEDAAMRELHRMLARVATSNIPVLLLGEMGTGKEVFASQLHKLSPRAAGPFRAINCAALSDTLVESELFGYMKGAFTGANADKEGLLESAARGTVFLDEVGELPLALQAKLLRVLEERKVRRMGANEERPIDVRFVAATNRDLERAVEEGRFRGDLFFRLNGFTFDIPPLRERGGEVVPLARRFLAMAALEEQRAAVPELSPSTLALLQQYPWPGNVRELRNEMKRAVVLADDDVVTPEHLSARLRSSVRSTRFTPGPPVAPASVTPPVAPVSAASAPLTPETVRPLAEVTAEAEREYLRRVLELFLHNQTRAAKALGLSRGQVVTLIERYDLPRPRS